MLFVKQGKKELSTSFTIYSKEPNLLGKVRKIDPKYYMHVMFIHSVVRTRLAVDTAPVATHLPNDKTSKNNYFFLD